MSRVATASVGVKENMSSNAVDSVRKLSASNSLPEVALEEPHEGFEVDLHCTIKLAIWRETFLAFTITPKEVYFVERAGVRLSDGLYFLKNEWN